MRIHARRAVERLLHDDKSPAVAAE
jgi:hypothetical protein